MSAVRTFIAVELSPESRQSLSGLIAGFRSAESGVKWVDEKNLHLTLQFLGDVRQEQLSEVCEAVILAARPLAPFEMRCAGLGAFPNLRRPSVYWIGVSQGAEEVAKLQTAIKRAVKRLGFPPEARKFHPHVTLGRLRRGAQLADAGELIEAQRDFDAGVSLVREAIVFSSDLTPRGPIYRPLAHALLEGGR